MNKNSANFKKNVNNKNIAKKIEIENFKEERLLLMSKIIKIILIIPTLNTKNSNIKFI
jgi:hypothetical protein